MPPAELKDYYEFGPFLLDVRERKLLGRGQSEQIPPKALGVLIELLVNRGRTVSNRALLEKVWPDTHVEENNIKVQINKLRDIFGDTDREAYIETTSRNGYRFVGEVKERSDLAVPVLTWPIEHLPVTPPTNGADPSNSPYIGPQSFPESRFADFFGRRTEIRKIPDLLSDSHNRVVLLYSPSGAGKTSLINAGLRPALMEAGYLVLPTARVGVPADPVLPRQNPYTFASIASMEKEHHSFSSLGPVTWQQYLSTKVGSSSKTVLVVDQLEEILTARTGTDQQRRAFFIEIREALINNPSLRVILSFRRDSLAEIQWLASELAEFWNPYQLTLLGRKEAKEAIEEPAFSRGVKFDPDVVSRLVDEMATTRYLDKNSGKVIENSGEFVEPLQLQLICDTLWRSLPPGHRIISWAELLRATGKENAEDDVLRRDQIVSRFAESVLHVFIEQAVRSASAAFQKESGHHFPKELIDLGCLQFVKGVSARTFVRQDQHWTGDIPNSVADELALCRLLRVEKYLEERLYELTHDTLIQPIRDRADRIKDEDLKAIFSSALRDIASTATDHPEALEENLILQVCSFLFVAEDGSRLQVSHEALQTNAELLPLWVVEALVQRGILRQIVHQEQESYELTHWRVARAIHQERSQLLAADQIFRIRKRLGTYLEQGRAPGASSEVWYQDSKDLLDEIKKVMGSFNFSVMEANFVLRASLASYSDVEDIEDFTNQIGKSHQTLTDEILREAIKNEENATVRQNVAYALGVFSLKDRETILINLALHDSDESVRRAAARTLARIDSSSAWKSLFAMLDDLSTRQRVLSALALMQDAVPEANLHEFERQRKKLSRKMRARWSAKLIGVRWQSARVRILLGLAVAIISTIIVTVPPRALLATFDLTTTQIAHKGFRATMDGLLNGFLGAVSWSLFIGGGLLFWRHVAEGRSPWRGRFYTLVGAVCGLIGGIANTFVLIQAYSSDTLFGMRWLPTNNSDLIEILTGTGTAFIMPVYGTAIGLGVGATARRILPWWNNEIELKHPIRKIFSKVLSNFWLILLPLFASAFILCAFLTLMPHQTVGCGKLFGESISIFFGGIGLVSGLFLGLHVLRKGLNISDYVARVR